MVTFFVSLPSNIYLLFFFLSFSSYIFLTLYLFLFIKISIYYQFFLFFRPLMLSVCFMWWYWSFFFYIGDETSFYNINWCGEILNLIILNLNGMGLISLLVRLEVWDISQDFRLRISCSFVFLCCVVFKKGCCIIFHLKESARELLQNGF